MNTIFRLLLFILTIVIFSQCEKDTPDPKVSIPDYNFLNALIDLGIDTNGDSAISKAEAISVKKLLLKEKDILDLTGIEAFIKIDTLDCSYNNLSILDVSYNTSLIALICCFNSLEELDLTGNPSLQLLDCTRNELGSLDLSNNIALKTLYCGNNPLGILDLSSCISLKDLICNNCKLTDISLTACTDLRYLFLYNSLSGGNKNQISFLNLSNNATLRYINLSNLPSLFEVCVYIIPLPDDVIINTEWSSNIIFTTDCSK